MSRSGRNSPSGSVRPPEPQLTAKRPTTRTEQSGVGSPTLSRFPRPPAESSRPTRSQSHPRSSDPRNRRMKRAHCCDPGMSSVRSLLSARACRIRAETKGLGCPPPAAIHVSGPSSPASAAAYKTAALPAELHRRETPCIVADPLPSRENGRSPRSLTLPGLPGVCLAGLHCPAGAGKQLPTCPTSASRNTDCCAGYCDYAVSGFTFRTNSGGPARGVAG
jgi:hypothetical protein